MAFTVEGKSLLDLGSERSVQIFRAIAFAEAFRANIPKSLINISEKSNTADGGLDGVIDNTANHTSQFIHAGLNGYQIKAYDAGPAECAKELHVRDDLTKPFKPSLLKHLNAGGNYIVVMYATLTHVMKEDRVKTIKADLVKHGFTNTQVDLWDASNIASYCSLFPGVISYLQPEFMNLVPHSIWADSAQMKDPEKYYFDDTREKSSQEIQQKIISATEVLFFRVDGLPGIGKTRFVCETLRSPELASSTVYIHADSFFSSTALAAFQKDNSLSGTVVIDECSLEQHNTLVALFQKKSRKLVFITMSYQMGKPSGTSDRISLAGLPNEIIDKILIENYPSLPPDIRYKLVKFSDGFPRMATLLGDSFSKNPNASQRIEDEVLMDRLIAGKHPLDTEGKETRSVLAAISIFEKIGFGDDVSSEYEWLCDILGIERRIFRRVVGEQQVRGIVQGKNFIYVTPQALKVHLIDIWWREHGISYVSFNSFVSSMPVGSRADLFERFVGHIPYLDASHKGRGFVDKVLDPIAGLFGDPQSLKDKMSANFFLQLTDVQPESALVVLEKNFSTLSPQDLLAFREGRREIIEALERIVVWEKLFVRGIRLLLRLALSENEGYSNNSTGILADLFSIGSHEAANTETIPAIRLEVITEWINSQNPAIRSIGYKCLEKFLDTDGGLRTIGVEFQGTRIASLYKPKTWEELFTAWKSGWELLLVLVRSGSVEAWEIAINQARGAIPIPVLTELIVQVLENIKTTDEKTLKKIFISIQQIIRFTSPKKLDESIIKRLNAIQEAPSGGDKLKADLRRFVGTPHYGDPITIGRDEAVKAREFKVQEIAEKWVSSPQDFEGHLEWLFSPDAENAWVLGRALANTKNFTPILNRLAEYLVANSRSVKNDTLLGGFLSRLRETNPKEADRVLFDIAKRAPMHLTELIYRSGGTDELIDLLLETDKRVSLPFRQFVFLSYGGALEAVSTGKVVELVTYILGKKDPSAASIALQMVEFYFSKEKESETPIALAVEILTDQRLLNPTEGSANNMTDHYWTELANQVTKLDQTTLLPLALALIASFGADGSVTDGYKPITTSIINKAIGSHSQELWSAISPYLDSMKSKTDWAIKRWLESGINYFPKDLILDWISKDPENRAPIIASLAPSHFGHESDSIARELIVKYSNVKGVLGSLAAKTRSGVFWGPISNHCQAEADRYYELAKDEPIESIKNWFLNIASHAAAEAKKARLQEERKD